MALPRYDITIDEKYSEDGQDLGINQIAFTSNPAVLIKGVAFNSQQKTLFFADEKKMRIIAPMLIPMQIYRKDEEDGYEYEVVFSEQVIDELHSKMMREFNSQNLFNLEHDSKQTVPAYLLESWIVDESLKDKSYSTYGIEVPRGTLMAVVQITEKDYYDNLVKSGAIGLSIEGFLGMKEVTKLNNNNMKLPDGEHLIDGKIYVVKDGEVLEIKEQEEMAEEVVEEVVEEEMAEEVVEEVVEEEMAEDTQVTEEQIMAIVQPKLDEILLLIAEVKAMTIPIEEEEEEEKIEMSKLNAHEKLKSFMNFNKQI